MDNGSQKILVVDDEPDILEFLQAVLEEEGYGVHMTQKSEEVIKLVSDHAPSLILIDVLLSGKDGREVVKTLKSQGETRQIPIIMFSAHPNAEETMRAAGADDFLAKPFDIDELLMKMHQLLQSVA